MLDLRTGSPVWMAYRAPAVPHTPLRSDARTDVLIVGAGISGAMIADSLSTAGFRVMIIDRRGPVLGSTPASTALVQYELDVPLTRLAFALGRTRAERVWCRARLAVANLSARIDELGIACGKVERSSLYLAGDALDADGLRAEAKARRLAGLYSEHLTRVRLEERFGIARDGAILSPGNIAVDPRQLTAGLLRRAIARRARCFAPTEAVRLDADRSEVSVLTGDGPVITAAHVVLATGYELTELVPVAVHAVASTWVIATRRQPRALWPEEAMIWEASSPYLYLRTTADGRIICGGEDEPFTSAEARDALIRTKGARLEARLARLFPRVDARAAYAWTGAFGTTRTGLPFIGLAPNQRCIHAVAGYGGNGIAFARIAAEIIRADLTGAVDADADLFAFDSARG